MKRLNLVRVVSVLVVLLLIMAAIYAGLTKWNSRKTAGTTKENTYYAVFLTNGQVYFGYLADVEKQYITLTNIYYLQAAKSLQSTDSKDIQDSNSEAQLSLVKLGKELHGPKDQMNVNRDQVLFYEELKDDAKVVQTIKNNTNK